LNPRSYSAMNINKDKNHIDDRHLQTFNLCGREFIRKLFTDFGRKHGEYLQRGSDVSDIASIDHCIMNLPQNATEFLDAFIGVGDLYKQGMNEIVTNAHTGLVEDMDTSLPMPVIHVYGFSTHPTNPVSDMVEKAAKAMQCDMESIYSSSYPSFAHQEGPKESNDQVIQNGITSVDRIDGHQNNENCHGIIVRDVAPAKLMICLSFRLPREVAFLNRDGGQAKRRRVEETPF
jgi:tRNA G37 N-methylase Trm5